MPYQIYRNYRITTLIEFVIQYLEAYAQLETLIFIPRLILHQISAYFITLCVIGVRKSKEKNTHLIGSKSFSLSTFSVRNPLLYFTSIVSGVQRHRSVQDITLDAVS